MASYADLPEEVRERIIRLAPSEIRRVSKESRTISDDVCQRDTQRGLYCSRENIRTPCYSYCKRNGGIKMVKKEVMDLLRKKTFFGLPITEINVEIDIYDEYGIEGNNFIGKYRFEYLHVLGVYSQAMLKLVREQNVNPEMNRMHDSYMELIGNHESDDPRVRDMYDNDETPLYVRGARTTKEIEFMFDSLDFVLKDERFYPVISGFDIRNDVHSDDDPDRRSIYISEQHFLNNRYFYRGGFPDYETYDQDF